MEGMLNSQSNITFVKNDTKKKIITDETNLDFIYCTEFLINGGYDADIRHLRAFLSDIGDCPAVGIHSDIIKVHVHTNRPDLAIGKGLEIGELSDIKIDNMKIQAENGVNQWNSTQASNI